ncbi:cytosine permease [Marihabitans asiaticum]|uniref:Purine-cytosine permease-like protein n=1 Tax=Marihabitans asiaticum TaxID=415218 RepID=A0A560WA79_9MICO|nr:cytosine permease [Marihabitans asiaticum]TWD14536.1 purine-cytosine permease-like protein [Marihabitans asiaticum]
MSTQTAPDEDRTLEAVRRRGVETTGIEIIEESERTARPRDLFWPWFAANVSVFGISYAAFVLGFGISFAQAAIVSVVGVIISFALCGVIAIAGKRGSAPTMILSRAAFGVTGQKVPGVVSWLVSIGWETFLAIMAVLATSTIFDRLGWGGGAGTKVVAAIVVAALIVAASVAGYHIIMRMQSVLTWITAAITILYVAMTVDHIDTAALADLPSGSAGATIGALVMVMTGFGLGWINIAADWSRYQSRDASGAAIAGWNTLGGALAPALLVCYGLAIAGSDEAVREGIGGDPIGTLATLLPTWVLVPFLLAAILSLVSGAVLGIYSSGLTLLSLGVRIPRPMAALIDGIILTLGTFYVVFVAQDFLGPFQSFLITLGVPLAAWAGVMIADIALRRRDYDEGALFDTSGRYGAWDWVSIGTMALASTLGWGLVVNTFTDAASWNNWQGFLLEPLGLGTWNAADGYWEGNWAYANLGVLLALSLSFAVTYLARRGTVARQEERA